MEPGVATGSAPAGVADGVLRQVRRTPDAPALVDRDRHLDYAALDAASAAVADRLRRHGVRSGEAVAVCLPRSWQLVCAMLGILRLGAVVVPLDRLSPPDRRRHMLIDSASVALIHAGTPPDGLPDDVVPLAVADLLDPAPDAVALATVAPAPASFLFYTSGTTGQPKGVEVRDVGILRLARPGYLDLDGPARFACLSNPAFDALSFDVWVPLLTGGCCVILDDEAVETPHLLAAALPRERVDVLFMTVALFNATVSAVPDCFAGVGQVLVGGEQLNARLIRRWYRDNPESTTRLYNAYGPTETTTFALDHLIPRDFAGEVVPIGRALPGTETVLVVDGTRLAAPGEVADLYLGGDCLALGYRNLPDETARRFVRLEWLDGGANRYYHTGDLVRCDADGLVEYVGRTDRQVKVRGFRIEPGELERQIVAHPAVHQAYVCTRRDPVDDVNELLAYLVLGTDLSFVDFDRHLVASLPPYMRPHRVYLVDALPLNANGKVDQDALLDRDDPPWRRTDAVETTTTAWQRDVLDLAGEVLGVPGLRLDDRWIANGGDSLKALRLRFEVRRRWGSELPQALVLREDFARLADAIEASRSDAESPYPVPASPSGARRAPATSEQQRLWLLRQQMPESRAYHVGMAFRLSGTVDADVLRQSLRRLVANHPALRTAFVATSDGLRQEVAEPYDPWIEAGTDPELDDGGWRAYARRLFATPFDLSRPYLFQACWLPQDGGGVLLLYVHHIAVDGWSLNVLFRALSADYAAALRGEEIAGTDAPTPLDYAVWQADWFTRPGYLAQRAALREHYAGLDDVAAPLRPIHPSSAGDGRLLHTSLDLVRRAALDRLGARLGLTRFQVLLGVFAWSLYGVTGRAHPRIASPVANRPVQDFEASVGMFANTVLLPLDLAPHEDLRAQLLRQGAAMQTVLDRQDVALADVLSDRDFHADGPLFDFLFVLENTDFAALALAGCESWPEWLAPAEAKCPLTLLVVEHEGGFDCLWEYADGYFDTAEIEAIAGLFRQGVDWLTEGRQATLAEMVAPYRRSLAEPGLGIPAPLGFATAAEGFAHQVASTPTATALVSGGRAVSYADLDGYAAALAGDLRRRYPIAPDDDRPHCVALHFEASVEHIVALLALARLNLTIVPLDPAYPPALLRQILGQIEPLCILLRPGGETALDAIDDAGTVARHPVTLSSAGGPALRPHAGTRPLYTLFTSGSTGTPKGVQVSDRTLCNLIQWQGEAGGLAGRAVTLQFSMLSFDVSFQEILGTLCGGGTLHLIQPGWRQDMAALLTYLDEAGIERVFMPYVALQLLAEHGTHLGRYPARLREVVTAGEQLLCTDAIRRWFAGLLGARLFNHYGPTETHVVSGLCLDGDPALWPARPAIGRPIANAWLRVVDDSDEAVPPGCPGHLLLGGAMVTPCYLNDEEMNRTRFVELPGLGLFYRSGDQARFDRDGLLHYLGRDDQQVKVSGHRLELGQVEVALSRHPAIVNAVVVRDGEQLVACLQCRGETPTPEDLARHLAPLLPAYVRIDRFRRLVELPRTASGKLDRRAALALPGEELRPKVVVAPTLSPREARLTTLFEAVIGKPIGPEQRFFDAGASSLGLMRFHLRCTAELGLPLTIPDLFEHVTIRRLAHFLDGRTAGPAGPEIPAAGTVDEPIAIIGMAVRLPGADDLAAFWTMVESGGRGIEYFDAVDGLVGARSRMTGLLAFDPEHFGISRQEARLMDPQQRHLLMSCVEALAHAGIADPAGRSIGLVAGCGENTYFQSMLREADPAYLPDGFQMALHHDKDFLATKVAFHLDLSGPAFSVQAACASSLVAVHVAAGMLRQGDAEVMLAGGVLVDTLLGDGYRYRPQHIFSQDGHCRPFSDDASGTIGASGVGVVVLKPLRLARRDGDTVYAVVTGSALNNDGAGKLSYSAPSLAGQRAVIRAALGRSGHSGADLGYVEAHGTGTQLGDPVEVGALRQAFDLTESDRCALTSVKSQIGHLGAAAGVVGLVRATLSVHHGLIPPNVDFHALNPEIGPDPTPFYIPIEARPWPVDRPRVAAVSSFGIGGTNAHVILDAAEPAPVPASSVPVLVLSATSAAALAADAVRIADHLAARPESYPQVLRHLQAGRPGRRWRAAAVRADVAAAVAWLRTASAVAVPTGTSRSAAGETPEALVAAWLAGAEIGWPAGPAQAPWDFPPPAFRTADFDFERAAPVSERSTTDPRDWPVRVPETEWLHQPHWVRLRRAGAAEPGARKPGTVVVLSAESLAAEALRPFEARWTRVVRVTAADAYAHPADDVYEVDPTDPVSLGRLLDELTGGDVDWLHALPLSVDGPIGTEALDRAYRACLDTPAALLRAIAGTPLASRIRFWWLSQRAQPVEGVVERPESGLLAGVTEVAPQEYAIDGHWLDLPSADLAAWAPMLADAVGGTEELPRRTALRHGYWWRSATIPVASAAGEPVLRSGPGVHLILGGTGGIGTTLAAWLLDRCDGRVVLLARRATLPVELEPWADRVDLVAADLAVESSETILARLDPYLGRLDGVVHAVGIGVGGVIDRRDAVATRTATASKPRGALLVERLIDRYRPEFAVYCSSMSAQYGGVGQFDYAAANGLLDGFARYRGGEAETTLRIAVDWDIWAEVGMAREAPHADARHRAHLAVGLTAAEGRRLFAQALRVQLPQVFVSTTEVERARAFYAPLSGTTAQSVPATQSAAGQLADCLCRWLGLDRLDPETSLYDLGADSLTLLDLIGEVKERFGVDIVLSQLGHQASLAEVLALLGEADAGESVIEESTADPVSLEVWQAGTGRVVLCLVHPVGGDIQAYRSLVSALDPRLTVCLIADPALRRPELSAWPLGERAWRYHAALRARFPHGEWRWQLAGWSFGAWVALAMAAEAEAAGMPAAGLHLIDPPPPDAGPRLEAYDETELAAVFALELDRGGAAPMGSEANAYAERLARCCRANLASMTHYVLPSLAVTPSRLWLANDPVAGLPVLGSPTSQRRSWQSRLPGLSDWYHLDTTHYGIVRPPRVGAIADVINTVSLPSDAPTTATEPDVRPL